MGFYFGVQIIFITDMLAIKFFSDISTEFIPNSITFF